MAGWSACAALVAVLLACGAAAQDSEVLVELANGVVRGSVVNTHRRFLGIPFGQPPVGNLRWKAPLPALPWEGVWDATRRSNDCLQHSTGDWFVPTSEDCLYLNVFAPLASAGLEDLAVLVFIYGGSNTSGGISIPAYNGGGVVDLVKDVVVVTLNYRLNLFGFLGGEELARDSADGGSGNFAYKDQRLAMQWVRDNIAAFGGNPDRIMIFGESAGSVNVGTHLALPQSAGYFVGAVMESGSPAYFAKTMDQADNYYTELANAVNCTSLVCMRDTDPTTLILASRSLGNGLGDFAPTIDNVELFAPVEDLLAVRAIVHYGALYSHVATVW